MPDSQNSQKSGIGFGEDGLPAPSDILPNSENLLDYQTKAAYLKEEIKKEFMGEQEKRLRKEITRQLKREQARGVQMDAEEWGRKMFVRMERQLRQKIEAELRPKIEKELRQKFQAELDAARNDENARPAN